MNIDLGKLETLIKGERSPENRQEELFILFYKTGLSNEMIMYTLLQIKAEIDQFDIIDYQYMILGMALGDRDYREVLKQSYKHLENIKITH